MIETSNLTVSEKIRIQDLVSAIVDNITPAQNGETTQRHLLNYLEGFVVGFKLAATLNNAEQKQNP